MIYFNFVTEKETKAFDKHQSINDVHWWEIDQSNHCCSMMIDSKLAPVNEDEFWDRNEYPCLDRYWNDRRILPRSCAKLMRNNLTKINIDGLNRWLSTNNRNRDSYVYCY